MRFFTTIITAVAADIISYFIRKRLDRDIK
jgi:hypothetical protein